MLSNLRRFARAALAVFLVPAAASAQQIVFDDFANVGSLRLNGVTQTVVTGDGPVLRLVDSVSSSNGRAGSCFYVTPVRVEHFTTHFAFRITAPVNTGADGLVFVVQRRGADALGYPGVGLGYRGIAPSAAVEFDTWRNPELNDPEANHVGVLADGSVHHHARNPAVPISPSMENGEVWHAWVDYDGAALELRLAASPIRPAAAVLRREKDLVNEIGGAMAFVGFTAGTWSAWENIDVLEWQFTSHLAGLEMRGSSPGWAGFRAFDLEPGDHAAFVFATGRGFEPIPASAACSGTLLGLAPPHFVRALRRAGPQGRTVWNYVHVPPAAHGSAFIQAVNLTSCDTSNVIAL